MKKYQIKDWEKYQKQMKWTQKDWDESPEKLDRIVGWIYQLSPHNLWKARETLDDLLSQEREKLKEEIKEYVENIKWDGRLSGQQMLDNILDYLK